MRAFCTYFDSNYIDKGLCLWASLRRFSANDRLFVCCLDDKVSDILSTLDIAGITLVPVGDVEATFPELLEARPTRSRVEYFFTLTPSWIRYVLDTTETVDELTYLDSDLLFFTDPQPLFDELKSKQGHVGIIAHRFVESLKHLEANGLYNVGWLTFRRTAAGMACLRDWQEKCIEWCYDRVEDDRFADQKYLDAWPSRHEGVVVLEHPGANAALWNLEAGSVANRGGTLEVHGRPLIFYHFHGLSQLGPRIFFSNARAYGVRLDRVVRREVYGLYMALLRSAQRSLKGVDFQPLLRYKYTTDDVSYAKRHPFAGNFLVSLRSLGDLWHVGGRLNMKEASSSTSLDEGSRKGSAASLATAKASPSGGALGRHR